MPGKYGTDTEVSLGALAMVRAVYTASDDTLAIGIINRYGGDRPGNEKLCGLAFDLAAITAQVILEATGYDVEAAIARVDTMLLQTSTRATL